VAIWCSCLISQAACVDRARTVVSPLRSDLAREPLGVNGGAHLSIQALGFAQRLVSRRRIASLPRQLGAQLEECV
jgi:hypothetical protein